jgi:hypothetical protein
VEHLMMMPIDASALEFRFFLNEWTRTLRRAYQLNPGGNRLASVQAAGKLLEITIREAFVSEPQEAEHWIRTMELVLNATIESKRDSSRPAQCA